MHRSILSALVATVTLVVAGCGVGFAYHPGYVYYDANRRPYTYTEYGGGYRTVYVEPSQVYYRGGVAVVGSGGGYVQGPPQGGVYVAPPRGGVYVAPPQGGVYVEGGRDDHDHDHDGRGGFHGDGRGAVEVNAPPGGRGAVEVNSR